MEIVDWVIWSITETLKYVTITYALLGMEFRRGKVKYLFLLYPLICILICGFWSVNRIYFQTFWGLLLILGCFRGKVVKKCEAFVFEYMFISLVDWLVWNMLVWKGDWELTDERYAIRWIGNVIGLVIWLILAEILKKYKASIKEVFEELSLKSALMLLFLLLGVSGIAGLSQGNILGEVDVFEEEAGVMLAILSEVLVLLVLVFIGVFFYCLNSKRQLEVMNLLAKKCLIYQKDYYEKVIENNQEMKSFRHDIRKHMNALAILAKEGRMEEVQQYIAELRGEFSDIILEYTGNSIADYFVNEVIMILKTKPGAEYEVIGRFPKEMKICSEDFCVLWGNAMDNAKTAIQKYRGIPKLEIIIKNYKGNLFIQIINSVNRKDEEEDKVWEKEKRQGYGLKNMGTVVKKYGGNMEWRTEKELFILEIEI